MNAEVALTSWAMVILLSASAMGLIAMKENRPALLLFAVFCVFYLAIRPVMLLTGYYGDFAALHFGAESYRAGKLWPVFLNVSLSLLVVCISYWSRPFRGGGWLVNWPAWATRNQFLFVGVWLAIVVLASLRQISVVSGIFFGFVLFGACYFLTRGRQASRSPALVLVGLAGIAFALASSVERRDWAVSLYAIGWTVFLSESTSNLKRMIYGVLLAVGVAYVAMALRTEGEVLERFSGADRALVLGIAEWELDFPLVYDDVVILFDRVPSDQAFLYGESLAKPLYSWVPRSLWREKPQTLSREFTERFNARFYDAGGSEPLTFIGDFYWNFGWFGLILCVFVGRIQRAIDDTYLLAKSLLIVSDQLGRPVMAATATLSAMMFYVYRGPGDTVWMNFGAVLMLLWLLTRLQAALWNTER